MASEAPISRYPEGFSGCCGNGEAAGAAGLRAALDCCEVQAALGRGGPVAGCLAVPKSGRMRDAALTGDEDEVSRWDAMVAGSGLVGMRVSLPGTGKLVRARRRAAARQSWPRGVGRVAECDAARCCEARIAGRAT